MQFIRISGEVYLRTLKIINFLIASLSSQFSAEFKFICDACFVRLFGFFSAFNNCHCNLLITSPFCSIHGKPHEMGWCWCRIIFRS